MRTLSLEGVTLKDTNLPFDSVSNSVTPARPEWSRTSIPFLWLSLGEKKIEANQLVGSHLFFSCNSHTKGFFFLLPRLLQVPLRVTLIQNGGLRGVFDHGWYEFQWEYWSTKAFVLVSGLKNFFLPLIFQWLYINEISLIQKVDVRLYFV